MPQPNPGFHGADDGGRESMGMFDRGQASGSHHAAARHDRGAREGGISSGPTPRMLAVIASDDAAIPPSHETSIPAAPGFEVVARVGVADVSEWLARRSCDGILLGLC